MTRDELMDLDGALVRTLDGHIAMLIRHGHEGNDNIVGIQVSGEEDIRWLDCDRLAPDGGEGTLREISAASSSLDQPPFIPTPSGEVDPRYMGERPNQGTLEPVSPKGDEGYAVLRCGGTQVVLSYTALHWMSGWLAAGSEGFDGVRDSRAICRAFNAVVGEAAIGNFPAHDL